jgi:hypothetical protein
VTTPRLRLGRVASILALAVLGAVAVSSVPVGAAPPPSDDPPDRPGPPRPGPPTTPPPPPRLESLSVTADSVVATAVVRHRDTTGLVTVEWGDGSVSSRNPNGPVESPRPNPHPDPPGTITFTHAYVPPADGAAFAVAVTARIGSEARTVAAIVTPRYQVTQYAATLAPITHCDTDVEAVTEWRVERQIPPLADKTWELDRYGTYGDVLPDSTVSFDVTATERRQIEYRVSEVDPIVDDLGQLRLISLDPGLGSRPVVLDWHDWDGCRATLEADVEVTLLRPNVGRGPVLVD